MDVQKHIKKLMEERDWTDYRLAKGANLSHSTVTIFSQVVEIAFHIGDMLPQSPLWLYKWESS